MSVRWYYLSILAFAIFFPSVYGLFPIGCDEGPESEPQPEPSNTKFTRNLDRYISILSTSRLVEKLYKGIESDMKVLYNKLSYINDPSTPGPPNTLPIVAPTELYQFVVGLKLHCFNSTVELARALVQVDEVEIILPPPLPESASTADSNPLSPEEEEPNSLRRFQYLNDDIATDFIGRLGTLVYQYDQILLVAQQEWEDWQVQTIRNSKVAYETFRNGLNLITRKLKYAGMNLDMRRRELTVEELTALVADMGAVY
ncbi:hypothetical protein TWF281_010993 [Arthrobotrys megalospora]